MPRVLLLVAATAAWAQIYVSPEGDDANAGSTGSPVRTLARAVAIARDRSEARIVLRGGVYRLRETLTLTAADSGRVIEAAEGETAVISGGEPIGGWTVDERGWWRARASGVFTQLWVNGQRRYRPRFPSEGYHRIAARIAPTAAAAPRGFDRFRYRAGDLQPGWKNLSDVEVVPFHNWTVSRMRIRSLDEKERVATFTGPSRCVNDWCAFVAGNRFLIDNVAEALDAPGEWYLDRPAGELIYIPYVDETPETAEVVAPRLERLLLIDGASDVTLRGLRFEHTNYVLPPEGYSSFQSEVNLDAAVVLRNTRGVTIENCRVAHTGQHGIALNGSSRETRIERCTLFDLGAGGIRIGESARPATESAAPGWNVVRDNLLLGGGRHHPAGCGILITHSPHNLIERNTIRDFYYTGLSIGWSWGYGASFAHHNVARLNRIGQLGQGVLSDMGGIYTLGVSPGSELTRNYIYDIEAFDYGGWGLYHDEGSTGYLTAENVVDRSKTGGFHQHYGRDNRIENNILLYAREQQVQKTRVEPHNQFVFERNVVVGDRNPALGGGGATGSDATFRNNVYWLSGADPRFGNLSWEQWRARGQDEGSVVADPRLGEGYTIPEDSPAAVLGIRTPAVADAGSSLSDPADPPSPRAFPYAQSAPLTIAEDFEEFERADTPPFLTRREQGGAVVEMSAEQAVSGARSLKFIDPDGRSDSFPHIFYQPKWTNGPAGTAPVRVRGSFAVRPAGDAVFWHEWRTAGSPYVVGPSIRITDAGALTAAGAGTLMTVPRGQWVRLEIEATLGAGSYRLTTRLADGTSRVWESLPCSREWDNLGWWGFVSSSARPAEFYLDDVRLGAAE